MFKIGDMVRVSDSSYAYLIGVTATIIDVDVDLVQLRFFKMTRLGKTYWIHDSKLVHVKTKHGNWI